MQLADEDPDLVSAGEMVAGKYRIDSRIARGGMGSVWAGWDKALDRPVAVKFMAPSIASSRTLRERFLREAKAAAGLRTQFVVQIYEHGVHGRVPFIVMELLEGEDLHDRLKRERRMAPVAIARILNQMARGLRKAHAKGLIHRDLKPRNIYLARDDDEETVKILDFGIAKSMDGGIDGDTTKTGQVLGSLNYMSPEQARGLKDIDHRADLWSVAVILFRALTGRTLFTGESSGDVIVKICTEQLPNASEIAPGLPTSFDAFFAKALARNPEDRFASATELAHAFTDAIRRSHAEHAARGGAAAGAAIAPQSGEWTPGDDLGTPLSDIQSYPSVDYGQSGPGAATPHPRQSGRGLGSMPSAATRPSVPSAASHVTGPSDPSSGVDGSVAGGAAPSFPSAPSVRGPSVEIADTLAGDDGPVASGSPSGPLGYTSDSGHGELDTAIPRMGGRGRLWVGLGFGAALVAAMAIFALGRSGPDATDSTPGAGPSDEPAMTSSTADEGPSADPTATEPSTDDTAGAPSASTEEPATDAVETATAKSTSAPVATRTRTPRPAPKPTATAAPTTTNSKKARWGY